MKQTNDKMFAQNTHDIVASNSPNSSFIVRAKVPRPTCDREKELGYKPKSKKSKKPAKDQGKTDNVIEKDDSGDEMCCFGLFRRRKK